jgi:hypothetical protein
MLCGSLRGRGRSELMAPGAAVGVDDVADELALAAMFGADAVAFGTRSGKVALRRQLQQREPVLRRVVLRSRLLVGRLWRSARASGRLALTFVESTRP